MTTEAVNLPNDVIGGGAVGYLEFEKPLQRIEHDIQEMERERGSSGRALADDIRQQQTRYAATMERLYTSLTPWETVLVARHPKRPLATDYLKSIFRDVCELHGDRAFGDDKAIITAFARIGSHKVMFVGHNKGKDVKERIACNFGCAHPEGYRKALKKMQLAEKYGLPVVAFIDTQGAYPGVGAEERGIHYAIARNLMELSRLKTPIVCVVIGEGGSGGALGIAVGDRVAMLQHAFYSVISPEGCAAILWKTADQRKHAAEALRLTARDLMNLNIIDEIIPEPLGGAHRDPQTTAKNLEEFVVNALNELKRLNVASLVARRQERIRQLGGFFEAPGEIKTKPAAEVRRTRRSTSRSSRLGGRVVKADRVPA